MHSRWTLGEGFSRIILACTLLIFLFAEAVVIAASVGWPNAPAPLGTHEIDQLLVNVFLASIPFVAGIWGCIRVKRLQLKFGAEGQEASFVWLWRQYLTGAIVAYVAIVSVVMSLAVAFRPK